MSENKGNEYHVLVFKVEAVAITCVRVAGDSPDEEKKLALEEAVARAKEGKLVFKEPDSCFFALPVDEEGNLLAS